MASPLSRTANLDRPWFSHYAQGVPRVIEIPNQLLSEAIEAAVQKYADRTAIIYYGKKWSYAQMWAESGNFAARLVRDGIRPGDRVAIYLPNCPAYPLALIGALRAGAIVAQVSPLYLGQDLAGLLQDAQPKAIITLEILWPNLAKLLPGVSVPNVYISRLKELYPFPTNLFVNMVLRRQGRETQVPQGSGIHSFREATKTPGAPPVSRGDPKSTVAVLQYTGGTTGKPKAAMLTHYNLLANALQSNAWFASGSPGGETVLASIPFFHIYGLTVALNFPLLMGATLVLQTRPDIPELLKLIHKYHPTQLPGVPAIYQGINRNPNVRKYNIRSIKICLSGSAPLPLEVAKRFEELTGGNLVEGYGLSEASPATHANPIEGERREGSIGLPLPMTDQKVVDLETGTHELPTGEAGELCVRGPQVMLGYYQQPEETALVLNDGWLRTGDVARIDSDGYCYIVDRKKDLLIVGGLKVYPREVEEVLFQHPGVADAAVIGLPDENLGEVVQAFVVRKPGSQVTGADLIAFVRDRIAHYKAPRVVTFRDALPRSGVQKVLRRVLREETTSTASSPAPTIPAPTIPAR